MRRNRDRRARLGDYKMVDDRSGFTIHRSEARKEWTGLWVHKDEWEPRHPQEFVRGRKDDQAVREARPDVDDEVQLGSLSDTGSGTAYSANSASLDLGAKKTVSRLKFNFTTLSPGPDRLVVQYSDDDATWTTVDEVLITELIKAIQTGDDQSLPVFFEARYVRFGFRFLSSTAYSYDVTMTAYGGDEIPSVTAGDL